MESSEYKQIRLLPPNPTTKRGFRVSWSISYDENFLAYCCQNNVVLRNLKNFQESYVYTDFMHKVTNVRFSPQGLKIASGDEKGKVKIWELNKETKEFVVKKEHSMLTGGVQSIAWTDDGQRICAGGEGKDMFVKAILADSGTKIGDVFGPSKAVMTLDLKPKPYRLLVGGENFEIYVFDGVPFKHAKTLHTHQNFVNRVRFRPDGKQFVSVSSDKSIVIHDAETLEEVKKIEKAHSKGIMDVSWLDESSVITCSTDNTLKIWNVEDGIEIKQLSLSEDATEKVENQQLGLITESEQFLSVSLNSNINIWHGKDIFEDDKLTPSQIIQGHSNYIQSLEYVNGTLVSCDQDGKLFSWDADFWANAIKGEGHTTSVTHLTSFHNLLFSGGVDGTIKKSEKIEGSHVFEFKGSLKLDGCPVAMSAGNDKVLYVLQNNNKLTSIEIAGFTVLQTTEFKDYEATAMSFSFKNNELWVGDKKGLIHILDGGDFTQKSVIEKKHNHALSYIKVSKDGNLVASGDSYRYIYVFNTETKADVGCYTYHQAKIIHIDFNKDSTLMLTAGLDLTVGVAKLSDKTKKTIHRPNEKELTCAVFDNEDRLYTSGYDCSIRIWSK